jgi:hypothetical protein
MGSTIQYLALVERMKLVFEDEDRQEFTALVEEVFRTMPRDFDHPEEWEALQREYDREKESF